MSFNTVSVVGLGYIGLPTAAILASKGIKVIGVDINKNAVKTINQGLVHIVEPGLENMVKEAVGSGNLIAKHSSSKADAFLIAVPTPFTEEHTPDLSYIKSATRSLAPNLTKGNLVILESTSPVGTTEQVEKWLKQMRPDLLFPFEAGNSADIKIAYCPERVLPGKVLQELVTNDRVIGGLSESCSQLASELYSYFVQGQCIITTARTAEMTKLTENSFRDVNIAFANELSIICDKLNIDTWELIELANRHPRVNILSPGPGVGGHCIAVDPWFIIDKTPKEARLIKTAREVNDYKPEYIIGKIVKETKKHVNPVIACLGLSFKANIDDLRESPALDITETIHSLNLGEIIVVEPNIKSLPNTLRGEDIKLSSLEVALDRANIIALFVDHDEFKSITKAKLENKSIIDTKGLIK